MFWSILLSISNNGVNVFSDTPRPHIPLLKPTTSFSFLRSIYGKADARVL